MGKFCRLATLIFGLAWIWWKALHSSQSTWCMCSRASSSPELCTYSADPIDKTAPRNVDVKLVCAQMLPRLRKNFFGHAGALARNICEKLVALCVCQFHIGKATQEFIELFLQFSINTGCHAEHAVSIIGETIPIECGELRNSNLCPMSHPKAKSLDWCYHRLNATWRWLDSL